MFESLIVAITESIIISCTKTVCQKISLRLKKYKIKKELKAKLQDDILNKHGDMTYYNDLDSFLVSEEFANKLLSHCFHPGALPLKSINAYLTYLSEKFVDKYPTHFIAKSYIYQDLYTLAKLIFDIVNDYSKDETARLVVSQLKEAFNEHYTLLSEQNEKIIDLLKEGLPLPKEDNIADFKDKGKINLYKSSLTSQYICQSQYINRSIYTENDKSQSSVECLLNDKRIVLLGDPGSGKTYESINVLKQICTNNMFESYIPIYIKLMEYGIVYGSISDFIKSQLRPYYGELTDRQLTQELSTDKFIIILDGVDEILDAGARIKFFADINQMINTTSAYYYITSRINPYHNNIKNVIEYRIKDLTQEQILNELHKNGITASYSRQYYELFANPLFLQIGINVLKNISGKLYNKSQLFSAYIEEVCYKRDLTKSLPEGVFKNYHNILMSIGQLAFDTFEKPCLSVAEFDEFFGAKDKSFTTNNICDVFRIDIFKVGNIVSFSHKQFKEFFAAYYLIKKYDVQKNGDIYLELIKSDRWQEVMVFAAGLITDIDNQNVFLDMMLINNLKTYIQCVKHKNDLSATYEKLSNEDYTNKYLETIYNSYTLLIKTYFQNINTQFEPFKIKTAGADENKKVCLVGSISQDRKHLHFWFDWKDISETPIQIISESDMPNAHKDLERRAFIEGRRIVTHSVNLELSNLMGDSARQVVIDIIYSNLKDILDNCNLFESDHILYEKLCAQTKGIKLLKDKSIHEIAAWATNYVQKAYENFDSSHGAILAGVRYNKTDVINLMNIANYLDSREGTHENLSLPQPDLPLKSEWIWSVYSDERVKDRLKSFFLWRQIGFHEMVENNFPKMKDYFSLSKDSPYRYRIHIKFKDADDFSSDPSITYYRLSVDTNESIVPEIITDEPYPEFHDESLFKQIMQSFHNNGKERSGASITSAGFKMTLTSSKHSGMPLTSTIYEDFKKSFKELFE